MSLYHLALKVKGSFKLKMNMEIVILLCHYCYLKLNYSRSCWQHSIVIAVCHEFDSMILIHIKTNQNTKLPACI